jgi:hypothetical protein
MLVNPPLRPVMKSLTTWSSPMSSTIETGFWAEGRNERRKKSLASSGVERASMAVEGAYSLRILERWDGQRLRSSMRGTEDARHGERLVLEEFEARSGQSAQRSQNN